MIDTNPTKMLISTVSARQFEVPAIQLFLDGHGLASCEEVRGACGRGEGLSTQDVQHL